VRGGEAIGFLTSCHQGCVWDRKGRVCFSLFLEAGAGKTLNISLSNLREEELKVAAKECHLVGSLLGLARGAHPLRGVLGDI